MRTRAASTSARVGAVLARAASGLNVEHLLQDLTNGRQRIQLPGLHLIEQAPELGVLAHRLLEVAAGAGRGYREDLVCEVAAPAALELACRLEPRAMLQDLLPERAHALAPQRLGEHDRR